jgi:hypothetical protein
MIKITIFYDFYNFYNLETLHHNMDPYWDYT